LIVKAHFQGVLLWCVVEGIIYMRIMFVTPYVPSRIRVRPFNLIRCLAAEHEISLVSLLVDDYEWAIVEDVEQYCVSVELVALSRRQAYANCLRALPTRTPLRVAYYRSPAFVQRIREVIRRQRIELVHGELIKVVPALKAVLADEDIPVLYDSVDCISWFLQQRMETTRNPFKKAFLYTELRKMHCYEKQELADFEQVIISAQIDRERLGMLTGKRQSIQVVSNGVDTDYFAPWPGARQAHTLVFCAKLDYSPNAEAMLHFCKHTLPLVWKRRPDVRLVIVGSNPPPAVRALAADERITVTGYVPDTRPYVGTASVALAPLLVAAGKQNKILEAMAMCTPVVTSPDCCKAVGAEDGVHLLVAEEPRAYADAIVRLLDNPELGQQLGRAGRLFVTERYNWMASAQTLNRLYREMMARREERVLVGELATQ
jgi:sugar transferase (PEP-CTERM/EpsH1 system associated)